MHILEICVVVVFSLMYFGFITAIYVCYALRDNIEQLGQFGDAFGSVNALFSGLAFIGILISITIQHKDLAIQKLELRQSNEAFRTQNNILIEESRVSYLFKLIENHRGLVDTLSYSEKEGRIKGGHQILQERTDYIYKNFLDILSIYHLRNTPKAARICNEGYRELFSNQKEAVHVAENIAHIIQYVNRKLDNIIDYHTLVYMNLSLAERNTLTLYAASFDTAIKNELLASSFNYFQDVTDISFISTMPSPPLCSVRFSGGSISIKNNAKYPMLLKEIKFESNSGFNISEVFRIEIDEQKEIAVQCNHILNRNASSLKQINSGLFKLQNIHLVINFNDAEYTLLARVLL